MRFRRLGTLVILVALLLPVPAALGQEEAPLSLDVNSIDSSRHPQVDITVTAPQQLVGQDLTDAFTVVEDGQERPADVELVPTDDLEIVLLVDTSGSMGTDPMAAARAAATDFVRAMPRGVQLAVVAFDTTATVVNPFSTDRTAASEAISALESGGETALYDAVRAGLGLFGDAEDTRQAMVLLSDGGDTASRATLESARDALLAAEADLFVVELQTAESDPDALVTLARATDGRVVSTTSPQALGTLYEDIASQLVNVYALSYESQAAGPTTLRVDLRTEDLRAFSAQQVRLPIPRASRPDTEVSVLGVPEIATRVITPGVLAQSWIAYAGAAIVFTALAVALLATLAPRPQRVRLDTIVGSRSDTSGPPLQALTRRLVGVAERRLDRRGQTSKVALQLERAGVDLRPGEFIVLAFGGALVTTFLGFVVLGGIGALIGGVLGIFLARSLLRYLAERRRAQFAEQLPDTLQLMSGSLRTGYGVMQALDAVVREADEPTASEFRRLLMENRLGRDLSDSLVAMAQRIGLDDFDWVVQAITIHREVGGDLADVLDRVSDTIRERDQIRRQIKALSADGRLSAIILVALPIFMAVAISVLQPGYLTELTTNPIGWVMIGMGTVLMVIGTFWVRRLVRLVF